MEPYSTEHSLISLKLNRGNFTSKNMILWGGEIVNADKGLVRVETYGENVRLQEFGLIYLNKGLSFFIDKKTLDSLDVEYRESYVSTITEGTEQERLEKFSTKLRGSGSIKTVSFLNGQAIIE